LRICFLHVRFNTGAHYDTLSAFEFFPRVYSLTDLNLFNFKYGQPFIYERTTNPDVEPAPYGPVH
jgi:hypothetical protein